MSRFWTVAIDSWKKQMKSKSFWLMVIFPIIMAVAGTAISYFTQDNSENISYIVADEGLEELFKSYPDTKISDEKSARKLMEDKKIKNFVEIKEEEGILRADYYTRKLDSKNILTFNSILKEAQDYLNLKNADISPGKEEILKREPSFKLVEEGGESGIMYVFYFALVFYMYMMLVMYSNILVVEIATEKGSKMIEFIFSSIRAGKYFAGKIFGNFLAILTHTLIYLILGIGGFILIKSKGIFDKFQITNGKYLGQINIGMLIEIGILVVLSLLIFMIVAAMLGSLAQKQEDAGKVSTPMMLVIVFAFFTSIIFMEKDENLLIKILSYLPFVSVFFMPLRMIKGSVGLLSGILAIGILALSIFVVYKIASKVYKKNILNYSSNSLMKKILRKA